MNQYLDREANVQFIIKFLKKRDIEEDCEGWETIFPILLIERLKKVSHQCLKEYFTLEKKTFKKRRIDNKWIQSYEIAKEMLYRRFLCASCLYEIFAKKFLSVDVKQIINNVENDTYLYLNNHVTDVHKRRAWWHSIPYIFSLIKLYKKSNKDDKALILKYFTRLWTTYGLYKIAGEMLDKYKVRVLVLANDHNDINRCLIFNALEKGIKTVYVQHASVKRGFPRLDFTYSFLDGKESLDKYLYDGKPKGEVYLSGGVRFDSLYDKIAKRNYETHRIGIAINM